jgi:transposase
MLTIGGDSHTRTHTFVAVDELGRKIATTTVAATTDGNLDAIRWAGQ